MPPTLASSFFEQLKTLQPEIRVLERVEVQLREALTVAHDACPGCYADEHDFVRHLAHHVGQDVLDERWVSEVRIGDLWLAYSSGTGCPKASRLLRDRAQPVIEAASRGFDTSPHFVDEVRQTLFEKLLVVHGSRPPRILFYAGRGALEAWLRVATVRVAIDLIRQRRAVKDVGDDDMLDELNPSNDPELAYIRLRYADDMHAAVLEAFRALSVRERTILRLHLLDGLNIDRIGVLYHVHRATVARWIAHARDTLSAASHRALRERLGATDSEVKSLQRLVKSELHVCLSELLASSRDAPSSS